MKKGTLDFLVGFIVLMVTIGFVAFVYSSSRDNYKNQGEVYRIKVKFQDVMGIIDGSDVTIAGIKIGNVAKVKLDPKTYGALVVLEINNKVLIPKDSRASIITSGFVGNKMVSIDPGSDEAFLKDGDAIIYSTSALSLESLIGKLMYSMGNNKPSK